MDIDDTSDDNDQRERVIPIVPIEAMNRVADVFIDFVTYTMQLANIGFRKAINVYQIFCQVQTEGSLARKDATLQLFAAAGLKGYKCKYKTFEKRLNQCRNVCRFYKAIGPRMLTVNFKSIHFLSYQ